MGLFNFWKKAEPEPVKPKCKICCACPETKAKRDECIALHGPESATCAPLIEAHKQCLREAGFKAEKVALVRTLTGATEAGAARCLGAAGWNVATAVQRHRADWHPPAALKARVEALFERYRDPPGDAVLADGVERFCRDLGVEPDDVVMLVVSWHFQAAVMCEFSRSEFVDGMLSLGCGSIEDLRRELLELRAELDDPVKFRAVYRFAYGFSLEPGIKCLPLDVAVSMWRLLFSESRWPLLDDWCDFLEGSGAQTISRDTWNQLLPFIENVDAKFEDYDETSSWPHLMDDFVEYMRKKRGEE